MYKKDSKGKIRVWEAEVIEIGDAATEEELDWYIEITTGILDGKMSHTRKEVAAKNVGKSNETTKLEQARLEVESLKKAKYDKGYRESIEELDEVKMLPMLAHSYDKRGHDIIFPALVQPKLDGVRCIVTRHGDKIEYMSRGGKYYTVLEHLDGPMRLFLEEGASVDGELYHHGWSLQRIVSAVKAYDDDTPHINFFAYDLPMVDVDCETRQSMLTATLTNPQWLPTPIKFTYTDVVDNEETLMMYTRAFIDNGFEGAIVRNLLGGYEPNQRSKNLQKVKFMKNEEFPISGFTEELVYLTNRDGVSKTAHKAVVWECSLPSGKKFTCRPKGTLESRVEAYKTAEEQIGKLLTVQFQCLSDDGVPIFPIGIAVRDYE